MQGKQITDGMLARGQGCLLGQLSGDALGSLVEFRTAQEIAQRHPQGVRCLAEGGTWNTIAGQPTDDSEMALALARSLVERGAYDLKTARSAYLGWLQSNPFDCGSTVYGGLTGELVYSSQANGAMMRVSPLGIFGATHDWQHVAHWAEQDAEITHPHSTCVQANALYVMAIAYAISAGPEREQLYAQVTKWANERSVSTDLLDCVRRASNDPPQNYISQQGWVLVALQNALWQLLHAPTMEDGVVDTVMRGGDTDTNAAIAGALLGAAYGKEAVPKQWTETLRNCRPKHGRPNVHRPRPECYWPVDALELAEQLLYAGARSRTY